MEKFRFHNLRHVFALLVEFRVKTDEVDRNEVKTDEVD
jgi:hypothetical protein